jgi:hypothetical protein
MKNATLGLIGVSAFVGAIAGGTLDGAEANAAHRRIHATACGARFDDESVYVGSYLSPSSLSTLVYCPVPSNDTLPHSAVSTLNVHGYSSSSGEYSVQACAKSHDGASIGCGAFTSAGTGGYDSEAVGVDTSAWASNGAAFPYLYLMVPADAHFHGFYISN